MQIKLNQSQIEGIAAPARSNLDSFTLLFVCLISIILVSYPVFDFDMYWHLANGREMFNTGRIVLQEAFSYTHFGEKFANHEWLGQVVFYILWDNFGPNGLMGLKLLLVMFLVGLLYRTLRNANTPLGISALLCVLAILAGLNRYHERPELFSLFNMALLGFILYGYRSNQLSRKLLWLLPVIMVLWDWLHGAVYGLTFIMIFVGCENAKQLFPNLRQHVLLSPHDLQYLNKCFAVTILAMLINPLGISSYGIFVGYVVGEANMSQVISEFTPVTWGEFKVFIMMLAWAILLLWHNWRRIDITQLSLIVIFGAFALRFNRVTSIAAIVLVPVIASLLVGSMENSKGKWMSKVKSMSLFTIGILIMTYGYQIKFGDREPEADSDKYHYLKMYDEEFGYGLNDSFYPIGAVNFIKGNNLTGNFYNSGNLGGYLSYFITPERKIFQYNMGRVFGDPFYYVTHPEEFSELNVQYAIIDTESEMSALFPKQDWAAVYRDEASVLVVRRIPQNQALIDKFEIRYFDPGLSEGAMVSRFEASENFPRYVEEMGENLAYREDARIAAVWFEILGSHPNLSKLPYIRKLISSVLKYNHVVKLQEMVDHS